MRHSGSDVTALSAVIGLTQSREHGNIIFIYTDMFFTFLPVSPVQVLVVEAEVSGRKGGVGGAREVFKEQEVSYWLPGNNKPLDLFIKDLTMFVN